MKNFHLPFIFFVFCCSVIGRAQTTTLWTEPFDGNSQYTVDPGAEGSDGTSDYFFITDGSNIGPSYTDNVGTFFAGQDIDDTGWTGSANPSVLEWTGIDIEDYSSLEFTGLWASSFSGIDNTDYIIVEYQIDGNGYSKILEFRGTAQFNTMFQEDTDFNGVGDGTQLSSSFASFTKTISETGLLLDLRVSVALNSGSEDFAMDELALTGVFTSSSTIITTDVSGPFCIDDSNGADLDVDFTTSQTFIGQFTAQLSDENGDFTTPTDIGTGMTSPISCTIPAGTISGTGYRIRVNNSLPEEEGSPTAAFVVVNGIPEVSSEQATGGDGEATLEWVLPVSCYDEILVVANETAGISFVPTGDGTSYTVDNVYATSDQVVYQGTGTMETVTGLTNGTTYYFEIFTRLGSNWSSGVEVSATPEEIEIVSCEDFTNFPETSSSYSSGNFMGNDDVVWTYVRCRGDQSINGKTPMLQNNEAAEMTSATLMGGIGDLTFNYQQAFSSNVNLEVFVNDSSIGTVTSSSETGVVKMGSFTVEIPGDFTLSFKQAGGGQVLLDDVCWTAYEAQPCVEPTEAPTALNLTPASTEISGDFTGTGDNYLVLISTSSTLSENPVDETSYAIDDVIGNGTVVSTGLATSFTVSGLNTETQYYFFVFAYDAGCVGEPDYYLTPLEGDATTTVGVSDCFVDNCNFEIVPVTLNADMDTWTCTDGAYTANGFCGCDDGSELWLISPVFDFGVNTVRNFNMEVVESFDGSGVDLMYATDYAGDPTTATWVSIATYTANTSVSEDITTLLDNTTGVNFGIRYLTISGQGGSASGYTISNIVIESDDCSQITSPCEISSITTENGSTCDDNMTPTEGSDDTFTADVVVTFVGAPTTGNLVLSGDVTASVDVTTITSPHTFTELTFPANGMPISITATFDEDMACSLTNEMAHAGLSACLPATIPWKETFDIDGEGIAGVCTDPTDITFCGTNNPPVNEQWSIILGTDADLTALEATTDYFLTENGALVARDLADSGPVVNCELCFLSEIIDISSSPADFSVELSAVGGLEADDYADVYLIIDGNETQIPNWNGKGDETHTLIDDWETEIVTLGNIVGNSLQIKICAFNGASAENILIDNVCVLEATCRISDISIENTGTCDSNDPSLLTDDFYTADVVVSFSTIPATGTLDLTGDIVGTPPSVDASTLAGMTSYTFVGVQLKADGTGTDLTAAFSEEPSCSRSETDIDSGMSPCCAVSLEVTNTSECNDQGTVGDVGNEGDDDTFTTDIVVTYFNAPTTGNLILSGDVSASIDVTTITSPYTYSTGDLPANGVDLNVTASFSEDASCMGSTVIPGVESCSEIMPTTNGGLLINELGDEDQSVSSFVGSPEYLELLVIGDPADPTLNVNIEGWLIDDNNSITSEFGTGGESQGCFRIKTGCFTDIPAGSLIVIYNAGEGTGSMPAIDENDTNPANNVYVIPSNSSCLEITTEEILTQNSYTTNTYGATDINSWAIALNFRNSGGDVIQTRRPDGTFYHGMAYGLTGVTYPTFPNGNPSFTTTSNNNISYTCGNSTAAGQYQQSSSLTPGATNNANNASIVQALLDGTANYDELIGTDMTTENCVPLSIELLNFSVNLIENEVVLNWTTANEKDNHRFEVEYRNNDGNFVKIGTIFSKGNSNTIQNYRFVHQNKSEGLHYYRLRQVDLNGAVEFSPIQSVLIKNQIDDIVLYPNPVENILTIDFGKTYSYAKEISLINTNGQVIKKEKLTNDIETFELSLQNEPSGIYWIKIIMDNNIVTQKIVKQ